jgi:hypothetical protein
MSQCIDVATHIVRLLILGLLILGLLQFLPIDLVAIA